LHGKISDKIGMVEDEGERMRREKRRRTTK